MSTSTRHEHLYEVPQLANRYVNWVLIMHVHNALNACLMCWEIIGSLTINVMQILSL